MALLTRPISRVSTWLLLGLAVVTVVIVAACSSGGGSSSGSGSGSSGSAVSSTSPVIKSFEFNPSPISVKVGTAVTWTNLDATNHTVTSNTGAFTSSDIGQGKTYSYTFTKVGTYQYHCAIHDYMHGTVIVHN